jgi:hypothetical protein
LAGATRRCAERERPVSRSVHVGRIAEIEEVKKQLNGADRFEIQQKLMPYEDLLPERFHGKNERIDDMMEGAR